MPTFPRAPLSRTLLAFFAVAAAIAGVTIVRPTLTPGPPMRDFEAYYAAGTVWNSGGDPYSMQIWAAERPLDAGAARTFEPLPFVGPPAILPIAGAIARLPFDTANVLWRCILSTAAILLAIAAIQLAELPVTVLSFVLVAVAALGFGPLTSAYALGQLALPACAFAAFAMRRSWAALFAWIQPNIALSAVTVRNFIVYSLLFAALCAAIAGRNGLLRYSDLLRAHGRAEEFAMIQLTPASIAYGLGGTPSVAAIAGGIIAAAAFGIWLLRVLPMRDAVAKFCATCALLPLALPFFHEHDLIVTFAPAVILARRTHGAAFNWTLAAATLCAVDWLGLAQRPQALPQALLLAAAFACSLVALRERIAWRSFLVPSTVLLIVAAAGAFAFRHPAPVWPDAMAALTPGSAAGGISAAWHAELAATGLLAQDAFSAALRLGSLLGCAGLAAVALYVDVHHVVELRDRVGVEVL